MIESPRFHDSYFKWIQTWYFYSPFFPFLYQRSAPFSLHHNEPYLRPVGRLVEKYPIVWYKFLQGFTTHFLWIHQHHYYQSIGSNHSSALWEDVLVVQLLTIYWKCHFRQNRLIYVISKDFIPNSNFVVLNYDISQQISLVYEGLPSDDHFLMSHKPSDIFGISTAQGKLRLYIIKLYQVT